MDPLDAFMAEIDQQVQANIPNTTRAADGIECDEEADPVADYMEVGCLLVAPHETNTANHCRPFLIHITCSPRLSSKNTLSCCGL